MPHEFRDEPKKKITISLTGGQLEYLRTLNNYNLYIRWMIDSDEGFREFEKKQSAREGAE